MKKGSQQELGVKVIKESKYKYNVKQANGRGGTFTAKIQALKVKVNKQGEFDTIV